ncbi:MAG: phospho-sugar mutase [Clostridia bacterium]|nr:phospho-sugar mutase [Clostridia bacterium]
MDYMKEYELWLEKADSATVEELRSITNEKEIKDRFYTSLKFGTGGLRGVMGAGTNRMNKYMVGKATQGLSEYIKSEGPDPMKKGVVIAHDSRNNSKAFAKHTANVLCANGIKTYLFESLRPTPMLSFAVRHLGCFAGVVITASHNPKEYNGYKAYFGDGGQLPPEAADKVLAFIDKVDTFAVPEESEQKPVIIGKEVDEAYYECVLAQRQNKELDKKGFKLVYTPLHGSGNIPVREILRRSGFEEVLLVDEQVEPDGNFPTVKSPNPENKECFTRAIEIAKENDCSLIIGTDPDSDRVGIVVKASDGEYVTMTGNQVGVLLTDYLLSQPGVPENGAVISTIVSSRLIGKICEKKNIKYFDVLTGFKFIGEKIHEFETQNTYSFVLGLEESYGYLVGTYARDKDAVVGSMLIAEMAVYYSKQGKTLYDRLMEIYNEYGYYKEGVFSAELKGLDGAEKIKGIMKSLRKIDTAAFGVEKVTDYLNDDTGLPKSDVLQFELADGRSFIVRPSGTEPKIKLYMNTTGKTMAEASEREEELKKLALEMCGL